MDAGFIFSVAVVAGLVIGLLAVSHVGVRQVAAHKALRAALLEQAEAGEAEEEPPLPFEEPTLADLSEHEREIERAG